MITKHATSRTLIIQPAGNFDALMADHYRQQLQSLIEEGYHFLIFDFEQTPYINSSALGLLVELHHIVIEAGGSIKLINCNSAVQKLLRQTKLDMVFLGQPMQDESPGAVTEPETSDPRFDPLHAAMSHEIYLLTHMQETIGKMLSSEDPAAIGKSILNGVLSALRTECGALFWIDDHQTHITLAEWQDHREQGNTRQPLIHVPLKAGNLEHEIVSQRVAHLLRVHPVDAKRHPVLHQLGLGSALVTSIHTEKRCLGLLAIDATQVSDETRQLAAPVIASFCHVAGHALQNVELLHQVQEQKANLKVAYDKLRHSQQTLMDAGRLAAFGTVINGIGHLLNTRMAPMHAEIAALSRRDDLPKNLHRQLTSISTGSHQVSQIMDRLMSLTHTPDRGNDLFDLNDLILTARDLLQNKIDENHVSIELNLDKKIKPFIGDYDLMLQAMIAVLHRAITCLDPEATEEPLVSIETQVSKPWATISIEDNGPHCDSIDEEMWFDPLVPLTQDNPTQLFNLAIPRNVIHRHGGRLHIGSGPLGGTCITMELPTQPGNTSTGRADNDGDAMAI